MNITYEDEPIMTPFREVKVGTPFFWRDCLLMRVRNCQYERDESGMGAGNVVSLESGAIGHILDDDKVEIAHAEIVVHA